MSARWALVTLYYGARGKTVEMAAEDVLDHLKRVVDRGKVTMFLARPYAMRGLEPWRWRRKGSS